MSEQVGFTELENKLAAKGQVRASYRYCNASEYSRGVYERALQMGDELLTERAAGQVEPQAMVDLVVQAIYNAQKGLDGKLDQTR